MVKYPKLITIVDRERRTRTVLWGNLLLLLLFFSPEVADIWSILSGWCLYIYIYKRKIYGAINLIILY
jgi:hypothetical protein